MIHGDGLVSDGSVSEPLSLAHIPADLGREIDRSPAGEPGHHLGMRKLQLRVVPAKRGQESLWTETTSPPPFRSLMGQAKPPRKGFPHTESAGNSGIQPM